MIERCNTIPHALIRQAFLTHPAITPEAALTYLNDYFPQPNIGLFVGTENGSERALALVFLPFTPLSPAPDVVHFYNSGSKALSHALTDAVIAWCRQHGYNSLYATNGTFRSDSLWQRLFRRAGRSLRVGTNFRIDF